MKKIEMKKVLVHGVLAAAITLTGLAPMGFAGGASDTTIEKEDCYMRFDRSEEPKAAQVMINGKTPAEVLIEAQKAHDKYTEQSFESIERAACFF